MLRAQAQRLSAHVELLKKARQLYMARKLGIAPFLESSSNCVLGLDPVVLLGGRHCVRLFIEGCKT